MKSPYIITITRWQINISLWYTTLVHICKADKETGRLVMPVLEIFSLQQLQYALILLTQLIVFIIITLVMDGVLPYAVIFVPDSSSDFLPIIFESQSIRRLFMNHFDCLKSYVYHKIALGFIKNTFAIIKVRPLS